MAVSLFEIMAFCEELLDSSTLKDCSYNGLQVEGRSNEINKIVTGVTGNCELFNLARQAHADLVLVHHGIYWKGADPRLTGILGKRVKALGDMSLAAFHLPLDAHPLIGNNALMIKSLNAEVLGYLGGGGRETITMVGDFGSQNARLPQELADDLERLLGRRPLIMGPLDKTITKLAVCTGGGGFVLEGDLDGCTALITGEVHEQHYHLAKELGVTVFVAGHHATEMCGIRALGQCIRERFGIEEEFINVYSPV